MNVLTKYLYCSPSPRITCLITVYHFDMLCCACLSICPRGSTWVLLDGFLLNFKLGTYKYVKIQVLLNFYKNIRHFMWRPQYICDTILTEFSMEWGKFHIKVAEKITTHISCQLHCIQKLCHLWDNYAKHDTTSQAVGDISLLKPTGFFTYHQV